MINLPLLICIYMQRMHIELLLTGRTHHQMLCVNAPQAGDELYYNERWSLDTFGIVLSTMIAQRLQCHVVKL